MSLRGDLEDMAECTPEFSDGSKLGVSIWYMQGHFILYMPIYLNAYFDKPFTLPVYICIEVKEN